MPVLHTLLTRHDVIAFSIRQMRICVQQTGNDAQTPASTQSE